MKKSGILIANYLSSLIAAALLTACGSNPPSSAAIEPVPQSKVVALTVAPRQTDCESGENERCMLAKHAGEHNFTIFHGTIEGFSFEEGSQYTLLVRKEPIENPPVDHSGFHYSLIEMLKKEPESGKSNMEGKRWKLENFANSTQVTEKPPENVEVVLEFQNGRIGGNSGCNRFFGTYTERDPNELTIVLGGSTMMACPEALMRLEKNYLLAIGRTKSYAIDDDRLELRAEDDKPLATYHIEQDFGLIGPTWRLLSYNNDSGLESNLITESIHAQFDKNGKIAGFSGCNHYHAAYTAKDNELEIQTAAATRKFCNQAQIDVMQVEQKYLAILPRVAAYAIKGKRLTLYGNDGSRLAIYTSE